MPVGVGKIPISSEKVAVIAGVLLGVGVWVAVRAAVGVADGCFVGVGELVLVTGLGEAGCWLITGSGVADGGNAVAEGETSRRISVLVGWILALAVAVCSASGMLEMDRTIANTNANAKMPIAAMATTISFPMSRGINVSQTSNSAVMGKAT
jgi:hypothetical protein